MMIVSDSSPLISLAAIEKLTLLENLYDEIYAPMAVYAELVKPDKPFADDLKAFLSGKTKRVGNTTAVDLLLSDIGAGEAEAIVLALEHQPDLILIDDLKARKLAKMNGLVVTGTMGLLLEAKNKELITEVKPLISKLLSNGIRIGPKIIDIALRAAKEK